MEDPNAADGFAARMPANHTQWAVQYDVRHGVHEAGPWHCYAAVRCDAKADSGTAFTMGIYNTRERKPVMQRSVPIPEVAGNEYKTIDLGVHDLADGTYFWAAPVNNPDTVEAVYVDRFFMVRKR